MDPEARKKLLRSIPYGLYVIGVRVDKEVHAFTATWLSQSSMKPPLVMMGVRQGSRSLQMIQTARMFTVNFIRKENKTTAEHFFKPCSEPAGRLGRFAFHSAKTGAPILAEAVGYLECEVERIVETSGDHVIIVAGVTNAQLQDEAGTLLLSDTPWHYGG